MPAPLRVIQSSDPAQDIMDDVGEFIPHFRPVGAGVLLVMYERGNQKGGGEVKTKGGIIVPNTATGALAEDKYQGKVGLVVALGPIAFTEDASHRWGDAVPQVGDWVLISIGDSYSFDLPGPRRARMVDDVNVKLIVSREAFDAVW